MNATSNGNIETSNSQGDYIAVGFICLICLCCVCRCFANGGIEGFLEGNDSADAAQTRAKNRISARRASAQGVILDDLL